MSSSALSTFTRLCFFKISPGKNSSLLKSVLLSTIFTLDRNHLEESPEVSEYTPVIFPVCVVGVPFFVISNSGETRAGLPANQDNLPEREIVVPG